MTRPRITCMTCGRALTPGGPVCCPKPLTEDTETEARRGGAMRLYIAGPMTGREDFNYPAFYAAERDLTRSGFDVLNPAFDEKVPGGRPWEWYMRRALSMVLDSDGVALLDGWEMSRGATFEHLTARTLDMPCRPLQVWLDDPRGEGVAP